MIRFLEWKRFFPVDPREPTDTGLSVETEEIWEKVGDGDLECVGDGDLECVGDAPPFRHLASAASLCAGVSFKIASNVLS